MDNEAPPSLGDGAPPVAVAVAVAVVVAVARKGS